ncbi:hypothetical protein M885DRAFT_95637 [Pelagophyceae sp. CCMP2097]|nr:hypothetical protein M885DRAFT_95637 [Pelagophyceae sp. CCMP2097]
MPVASVLNVVEFCRTRLSELEVLEKALCDTGAVSEEARHLRRRARSHASVHWTNAKKGKVPNRRDRRKRAVLLESRSCHGDAEPHGVAAEQPRLLETHLWAAKRMRMAASHGSMIAECRADRGVRAAYRSALAGCVLRDVTMWRPVEVCGGRKSLGRVLDRLIRGGDAGAPGDAAAAVRRVVAPIGPVEAVVAPDGGRAWLWTEGSRPALVSRLAELVDAEAGLAGGGGDATDVAGRCRASDVAGGLCRFRLRGAGCAALLGKALSFNVDAAAVDGACALATIDVARPRGEAAVADDADPGTVWDDARRAASKSRLVDAAASGGPLGNGGGLPVDILLIRSRSRSVFDDGWDVVVPGGCAMPLWLLLVMSGASAIGRTEAAFL